MQELKELFKQLRQESLLANSEYEKAYIDYELSRSNMLEKFSQLKKSQIALENFLKQYVQIEIEEQKKEE